MKTKLIVLVSVMLCAIQFSPLFSLEAKAFASTGGGGSTMDCGSPGLQVDPTTGLCLPPQPAGAPRSVNDLLVRIINLMLGVAFIIDVLFILIGGYRYIFSNGNDSKAKLGRQTLLNALIGLAIIIFAYVIVQLVATTAGKTAVSAPPPGVLP